MKITDVRVTVITAGTPFEGPPGRSFANLVQVFTDQGIEGDFLAGGGRAAAAASAETVVNSVKPMILGKDPLDREAIWHTLAERGANMAVMIDHRSQHIGETSYIRGLQRGLNK